MLSISATTILFARTHDYWYTGGRPQSTCLAQQDHRQHSQSTGGGIEIERKLIKCKCYWSLGSWLLPIQTCKTSRWDCILWVGVDRHSGQGIGSCGWSAIIRGSRWCKEPMPISIGCMLSRMPIIHISNRGLISSWCLEVKDGHIGCLWACLGFANRQDDYLIQLAQAKQWRLTV